VPHLNERDKGEEEDAFNVSAFMVRAAPEEFPTFTRDNCTYSHKIGHSHFGLQQLFNHHRMHTDIILTAESRIDNSLPKHVKDKQRWLKKKSENSVATKLLQQQGLPKTLANSASLQQLQHWGKMRALHEDLIHTSESRVDARMSRRCRMYKNYRDRLRNLQLSNGVPEDEVALQGKAMAGSRGRRRKRGSPKGKAGAPGHAGVELAPGPESMDKDSSEDGVRITFEERNGTVFMQVAGNSGRKDGGEAAIARAGNGAVATASGNPPGPPPQGIIDMSDVLDESWYHPDGRVPKQALQDEWQGP